MNMEQEKDFDDATIPAYFIAVGKPYKILPYKPIPSHVRFRVKGEDIDKALEEMYANPSVPILDFIRAFKSLRSMIFSLKGGRP